MNRNDLEEGMKIIWENRSGDVRTAKIMFIVEGLDLIRIEDLLTGNAYFIGSENVVNIISKPKLNKSNPNQAFKMERKDGPVSNLCGSAGIYRWNGTVCELDKDAVQTPSKQTVCNSKRNTNQDDGR